MTRCGRRNRSVGTSRYNYLTYGRRRSYHTHRRSGMYHHRSRGNYHGCGFYHYRSGRNNHRSGLHYYGSSRLYHNGGCGRRNYYRSTYINRNMHTGICLSAHYAYG